MKRKETVHFRSGSRCAALMLMIVMAAVTAGCTPPDDVDAGITLMPSVEPTEQAEPTLEPEPEDILFICLNQQPESLYLYSDAYLYGSARLETNAILQAIYDGPFDILDYQVQPVILASIPSLETGDVRFETVTVADGEVYLNPVTLQPENLERGQSYLPADCADSSCIQTYGGGEVEMLQMQVDFHLQPGLTWSDGEPLTAHDSVFSYELDQDPGTPTTKYLVERTSAYSALDDVTVRWVGIPGFLDPDYATIFWSPLPQHQIGGVPASDVLAAEEPGLYPLGWGAYQIDVWGQEGLEMVPNPNYFRRDEGLPIYDRVIFRFLGSGGASAIQQVVSGECDVIDESLLSLEALPTVQELAGDGRLAIEVSPGAEIERMDFNLLRQYGDEDGISFADVRLREAIGRCIDRETIVDETLFGYGLVTDSFMSPHNPFYLAPEEGLAYDPDASAALLDQLGWVDEDGDPATPRIARGVLDNAFGTPLEFDLAYTPAGIEEQLAEQIQSDLATCGIGVNLVEMDQNDISAPYPDGVIFGGDFDAVIWAWPDWISPLCEMYAGWEIPSESNPFGSNASGYENSAYNEACRSALLGIPEQTTMQVIQERYWEDFPSIPLFTYPRYMVHSIDLVGVEPDDLVFSLIWNLEVFAPAE